MRQRRYKDVPLTQNFGDLFRKAQNEIQQNKPMEDVALGSELLLRERENSSGGVPVQIANAREDNDGGLQGSA